MLTSSYPSLYAILATACLSVVYVHSFSQVTPRPFIEFTNPLSQRGDSLPASFVSNWPTWVLDLDGGWHKIPDSGGFVPPTSVEELWQPLDLKQPTCRLALGLHVRDGTIRHVLPAVDLTLDDGHRNRGMCSVPRAHQWMDFGAAMAGGLDVVSLELQSREAGEDDDNPWETLAEIESVEDYVNSAIEALADDPPEELGDGSSVIHILCDSTKAPCPQWGSEMRVLLQEDGFTVGSLQVLIEKTAPGSESEYLPEAYKPLYEDESLRRETYMETKKRMEARAQKAAERAEKEAEMAGEE